MAEAKQPTSDQYTGLRPQASAGKELFYSPVDLHDGPAPARAPTCPASSSSSGGGRQGPSGQAMDERRAVKALRRS